MATQSEALTPFTYLDADLFVRLKILSHRDYSKRLQREAVRKGKILVGSFPFVKE